MKFQKKSVFVFSVIAFFIGFFGVLHRNPPPDVMLITEMGSDTDRGRVSAMILENFRSEFDISWASLKKIRREDWDRIPIAVQTLFQKTKQRKGRILLYQDSLAFNEMQFAKILGDSKEIRFAFSWADPDCIENISVLEKFFDAILVADLQSADRFKQRGIQIPVFTVPLEWDVDLFLHRPPKQKKGDPFLFLNGDAASEDGHILELIRTFASVYGNNPQVKLIINSSRAEGDYESRIRREMQQLRVNNIIFSRLRLERDAWVKILEDAECYVTFSKTAESNLRICEAKALGIPVHCFSPSESKEIIFKELYEKYEVHLAKAQTSRTEMAHFQPAPLKSLFSTLFRPRTVLLGSDNAITEDALITTSQALYEKYAR